jgi:CzcA family heavy metal efflux pump
MMNWLVSTALKLRVLVLAGSVVLMVVGLRAAQHAPLDVFPEFAPPLVEVQTEAPGLSTEEVESLVTLPLENALNGTIGLSTIRSKSVLGLSSVVLILKEGTDVMAARQVVQERLSVEASRLPAAARAPVILPPLSSTSRLMKIGLSSDTLSQMEMTQLAKWTIRPRLMSIRGVANVAIWGQRDTQYQVLVDPDRLRTNGVTLDALTKAVTDASAVGAGGFVDTPNQRIAVRHRSPIETPEDLAKVPVAFRSGVPLRLGDVADVKIGFPPPIGDAVINDGPGLLLIVEKQPTGNTLEVTREVKAALKALEPALQGVKVDPTIFQPAEFIERSLDNLTDAMKVGCILVVVILVSFLYDIRTALISLIAIPLSLIAATLVIMRMGATINTMVLAGLVIAMGEVVDDAIIDVENIVRRLRLNRAAGSPLSPFQVVLSASLEVRSAVVYASLIVVLVFLPVFFLDGLAGSFFRPLALAYVLAIGASLLVALTVTPALSLMLLPGSTDRHRESPLVRVLKAAYRAVLPGFTKRPGLAVATLVAAFGVTGYFVLGLGEEFLPNFQENDFLMHWVEKPGTSLEAMRRLTVRASQDLKQIKEVRNFGSHIGRAEVADEVVGPNFTELWISVDPKADYKTSMAKVQAVIDGYPGLVQKDVLTYLKERIKEVLTGSGATVVVRIYGPDMATLRSKAAEVASAIKDVDGVADLKVESQVLVPQLDVRLKPEAAANLGLSPGDVRRAATTLVKGAKVGELYKDQKILDVFVWGVEKVRSDVSALNALPVETPLGTHVPLGDVADVAIVAAPNEIKREGASRRIEVTCNVKGSDLGSVARAIEQRVRERVTFDREYHPEFLGEYAAREASRQRLLWLSALSLLGVLLVIHADFRTARLTALVALTLPFALIGGVFGAVLGGGVLSLGSLVGFVTVLGIAARNGIMLVSHYRHLEEEEGEPFGLGLVVRGSEERLSPILMTALATGLALVPLAVAGNKPGHEIEHPMAVVILGGLVTSTLLNLFLMPALYLAFGRARVEAPSPASAPKPTPSSSPSAAPLPVTAGKVAFGEGG